MCLPRADSAHEMAASGILADMPDISNTKTRFGCVVSPPAGSTASWMCAVQLIGRGTSNQVAPMTNQLLTRGLDRRCPRRSAKRTWSHLLSAVHCTATRPSEPLGRARYRTMLHISITLPPDRPCAPTNSLRSLNLCMHVHRAAQSGATRIQDCSSHHYAYPCYVEKAPRASRAPPP